MIMAVTIGVDPGVTGAVAVLEPDGQLRTFFDLPLIRDHARLLFASADLSHARHHGRAEALLIAYCGLQHGAGQRAAA
jgi:hypothetical protein